MVSIKSPWASMNLIQPPQLAVLCYAWPEKAVPVGFICEKVACPTVELLAMKVVVFPSTVLDVADDGTFTF